MSSIQHQQLILRLPDVLAEKVNAILNTGIELNEELLHVKPIDSAGGSGVDQYDFIIQGEKYPALLQNLPCLLESHKTVDMKILYKSGDIGQVLCVYLNEEAKLQAKREQRKLDDSLYFPHGISPPTHNIVKNKYSKTRDKQDYKIEKVQAVIEQIRNFDMKEKIRKEVVEEIVDFEDWMIDKSTGDGLKLKLDGAKWLQTSGSILLDNPNILNFHHLETHITKSNKAEVGSTLMVVPSVVASQETKEGDVSSKSDEGEADDDEWLKELEGDRSAQVSESAANSDTIEGKGDLFERRDATADSLEGEQVDDDDDAWLQDA